MPGPLLQGRAPACQQSAGAVPLYLLPLTQTIVLNSMTVAVPVVAPVVHGYVAISACPAHGVAHVDQQFT
jgi:hypothetical protein